METLDTSSSALSTLLVPATVCAAALDWKTEELPFNRIGANTQCYHSCNGSHTHTYTHIHIHTYTQQSIIHPDDAAQTLSLGIYNTSSFQALWALASRLDVRTIAIIAILHSDAYYLVKPIVLSRLPCHNIYSRAVHHF